MRDTAEPRPVDIVKAVYASHERRDTPGLVDLLDAEVEWVQAESHPYAGDRPWRGPDEVVEHVANPINEEWDGFLTHVEEYIDAGDKVVVLGRYRGVYKATGRAIDAQVCTVYTVRDGAIVRWQQYTDTAQIRDAMGMAGVGADA
ncbi:MAG TPA: nuclear transport factor 2 family protein [Acidimicrobiales bacterium]|nr:nuclear transport factor 2 family protein [Acidimicrobiales bacterium]